MSTIYSLVREAKESYQNRDIEVVEGYDFSQYDTLLLIDLMMNSRFQSGQQDALGRDKPFKNIVKFRRNVSVRATDIDTKDIQIKANRKKDEWNSFVLSLRLQYWMKQTNFAKFLNKANEVRATYGTAVVKKIKRDGVLHLEVVPWSNLITDQKDFFGAPIIQRHFYSPQQLRAKKSLGWDEDYIEQLIAQAEVEQRKRTHASDQDVDGDNKTQGHFIEIYEVHGEFPTSDIDENANEDDYSLQMHIISTHYKVDEKEVGCTLYSGRQDDIPYKTFDWDTQDGRALGIGVVEDLFEHQIWTNYLVKQEKDLIDLSSTLLYQRDPASEGDATNILTDTLPGEILDDQITQVNSTPTAFPALQANIQDWDTAASRQTATFEAKTGELKPSNATFRGTAILNAEADGHYQYKIEGFAVQLKPMLREWVIPYLFEDIRKNKDFAADLEPHELEQLDNRYAEMRASEDYTEALFSGKAMSPQEYQATIDTYKGLLEESGVRRYMEAPEDFVSDESAYELDILISGEQENKAATFENLSSILGAVAQAQQPDGSNALLDDPRLSQIFDKVVENTGVLSPLELRKPQKTAPQTGSVPVGDINNLLQQVNEQTGTS